VIRPAWAEIDVDAIARNVGVLVERAAPAAVCAVVKADGYGHGALRAASAALAGGASWLAVALPSEGVELRRAGIDAPILLLTEPDEWHDVVWARLTPTVYSEAGVGRLDRGLAGRATPPMGVHLKIDTGMHRVGVAPDEAIKRADLIASCAHLRLDAVWTHCPVADEPDNPFTDTQADRFDEVLADLRRAGHEVPMVHAANSAGTLCHPRLRYDMVRCGIAVYGLEPSPPLRQAVADLHPAMSLKALVRHVQQIPSGEAVSYGRKRPAPEETVVATVPIGYADGVPRRLFDVGAEVLIGGRRRPLAGTVTMDQILVDCGPGSPVEVGDEVVLLGRQGGEEITAGEWADLLGTISYEIVCGIGPRVPRLRGGPTFGA
jgi:alanine racemase